LTKLDEKFTKVVESVELLKARTESLEKYSAEVKWEIEGLKREANRRKFRISGIQENEKSYKDLEIKVNDIIKNGLQITDDINIEGIRRQGKKGSTPRVAVVTLNRISDKHKIFANKKILGNNAQFKSIYINEELTYEQAKIEGILRRKAKLWKATNPTLKSTIRNGILTIELDKKTSRHKVNKDGEVENI